MRSRHELTQYLQRHEVRAHEIPRIVRECERRGILNDQACARLWAEHWMRAGFGWLAIRDKLSAKGLEESIVVDVEHRLGQDEEERARAWLDSRSRGGFTTSRARQLIARGFDPDIVERIIPEDANG